MKKSLTLIALLLAAAAVSAFFAEKGGTTFATLKIPFSARVQAMGGAGVALAGDGGYATINPAGIARVEQDLIFLEHVNYFQAMQAEYLNATLLFGRFRLGVSMQYHDLGWGPITNEYGSDYSEDNMFHAYDAVLAFTSKVDYLDFNFGFSIKALREAIWNHNINGAAVDLGVLYKTPVKKLTAGASLLNLGYTDEFISEHFPITAILRLGAAYEYDVTDAVLIKPALDLNVTNDGEVTLPLGLEGYWNFMVFRGGYHFFHDTRAFSLGLGLSFGNVSIDYCYVHYTDEINSNGRPHFFALSLFI